MPRKVYIVDPQTTVTAQIAVDASAAGCAEIAQGIPAALVKAGVKGVYPFVYTEPDDPERAPAVLAINQLRNTYGTNRTAAQINNSLDALTVLMKKVVGELR